MRDRVNLPKRAELVCILWVALLFTMTSAAYLSWVRRMVALSYVAWADWFSLVLGYLCQAAGTGLFLISLRKMRGKGEYGGTALRRRLNLSLVFFLFVLIPALLSESIVSVVFFGSLLNLACGIIAGFYLYGIAGMPSGGRGGIVFGCGYAAAIVCTGVCSIPWGGALLKGRASCVFCAGLAALAAVLTGRLGIFREDASAGFASAAGAEGAAVQNASQGTPPASSGPEGVTGQIPSAAFFLACAAVVLACAEKNLGYGFPSADIASGVSPELSRIFYAVGLVAAGFVNEKDRKNGFICTVASLALPFLMLSLSSEEVPAEVLWCVDYFFYGFFSIFRVLLFLDIAGRTGRMEFAPVGLLAGRLGDAAGSAFCLLFSGNRMLLILMTASFFCLAIFLFFRLYQDLYEPRNVERKSEREVFEMFCLRHDLTSRERDIFRLMIDNHTNGEIAEALFISENTVKFHVRNVLQKTGCPNRMELQKLYRLALYREPELENVFTLYGRSS